MAKKVVKKKESKKIQVKKEVSHPKTEDKTWGIAGLVCSILGILFLLVFPLFGIIASILGIVFSVKQRKIEREGLSNAGLIIGIIGLVLNIILVILALVAILWVLSANSESQEAMGFAMEQIIANISNGSA